MQYSANDPRNISCCNGRPSAKRARCSPSNAYALWSFAKVLLAQNWEVAVAIEAMPTMRIPRQHDMIAHSNTARRAADLFNHSRSLVSEHHRHRVAQGTLDDLECDKARRRESEPEHHAAS